MKKILLLLVVVFSCLELHAKEVKLFKGFGLDNPMSYQFVRTITQDSHGFMWFGSHEGLHRFDGYQFVSFHHDSSDQQSLSSDVISKILIDSQQRLWVATSGAGLNLFHPQSRSFTRFTSQDQKVALSNDVVNVLFEDSRGQLWIGTEHGLNVLTQVDGEWRIKHIHQLLGDPDSLSHNTVHDIVETSGRQIWVGTNGGGISVFDLDGKFLNTLKLGDLASSTYLNKFVNSLFYGDDGKVWIGTLDNGLIQYDVVSREYKHYLSQENDPASIVSNTIKAMYRDAKGQLWIATDKGLLIHDQTNNNFQRYNHSPTNPYSLSNDYILSFFEDDNGMMWIGTFTGVNRWDSTMTTFSQYSSQTNSVLSNNNITSFAQFSEEQVILSTYSGGLYQLKPTTGDITKLDLSDYFANYRVMTLLADDEYLWVGTRGSGLHRINMTTKEVTQFQHDANNPESLSANSITDIVKDKNGHIWVSTFHQGINLLLDGMRFRRFPQITEAPERGPSSNHILQMLEAADGALWLATYGGGLSRLDMNTQSFTHLRMDKNDNTSVSSDTAWILFQDQNENLWVGTQAAGVNLLPRDRLMSEDYRFKHLDTKDGMKSRTVYGITEDSHGNLWFSSNKGISRYSSDTGNFKHFDLTHGLIDLEYNHAAIFKDLSNSLYFGAGKGFASVNPDKLYQNLQAPKVRLTNVFKLNEPMVFGQPLAEIDALELDYQDQIVSFEYVGLNYANPESTRYRYRLLGFDQQWIDAGKSRRATYTNLPAGTYELQIVAGNNDNIWSEPGRSLKIIVHPAPWNTWWAFLLYSMTVALLILAYSRFLNRKLVSEQEQKQQLKKQVEEKTQKYLQKNIELEQANKQLENAATTDKLTGVKSRRYLDIYIEQATQLMSQIHENILPVQRSVLPRLYVLMVQLRDLHQVSNSQLVDLTDLLLYSRNQDDLVIRWSENTFAIIGYEKDDNVRELAARLSNRYRQVVGSKTSVDLAYCFYPFNFEQPMALSWDQISVLTEFGLKLIQQNESLNWIGLYGPKEQPFNYLEVLQQKDLDDVARLVKIKQG